MAYLINNFLPGSWFVLPEHVMSHDHEILPEWLSIGSAIILVLLIINGYIMRLFNKKPDAKPVGDTSPENEFITMEVEGMTCNHCKQNVENAASSVEGVASASVDLGKNKLMLSGKNIDHEKVRSNIRSMGYEVKN
ncbi:MAG: cation transporter [Bacteroidales bacterium]|nr:cation transporter [Bacteroidales bacterium]